MWHHGCLCQCADLTRPVPCCDSRTCRLANALPPLHLLAHHTVFLRQAQFICRHTTRFVITYVAFMPLGLWRHCGYWTLVIAPLITFMLAGIENIGVQVRISGQNVATAF